jgi:hypothetical protein
MVAACFPASKKGDFGRFTRSPPAGAFPAVFLRVSEQKRNGLLFWRIEHFPQLAAEIFNQAAGAGKDSYRADADFATFFMNIPLQPRHVHRRAVPLFCRRDYIDR